ncbi:hypothetical protein QQZ08_006038 [Neonectria magnoliae]|uniref:Uncharacterized protein n=1 Tax=Neonectria magnoliae TaxID=2732573 RepID=A0ABR1I3B1_9HYPO
MEEFTDGRRSLSSQSSQATPRPKQESVTRGGRGAMSKSPPLPLEKPLGGSQEEDQKAFEAYLREQMEQEKTRFPGASGWAPAEARLFEILYMRQDLPMLPRTWDIDFSGVPISDVVFETSEEFPPIIYAHSKDFRATSSLMRLMGLTSKVRAQLQTGFRRKVPGLIKGELNRYLSWAAQDGDFAHLRIVPNIITEVIDTTMEEAKITVYIQNRMRDLARLQREFLRLDKDPQFWDVVKPSIMVSPQVKLEPEDDTPTMDNWPRVMARRHCSTLEPDELLAETPTRKKAVKLEDTPKRRRLFPCIATTGGDELAEYKLEEKHSTATKTERNKTPETEKEQTRNSSSLESSPSPHGRPKTPTRPNYRRHPPVVYGLFIINTTVLLLTVDASLDDSAYVSFHVQADFGDQNQSVWNALTIAIAVCLARDELMSRISDFEELPVVVDSDPDA